MEKTKISDKEARIGPILKKKNLATNGSEDKTVVQLYRPLTFYKNVPNNTLKINFNLSDKLRVCFLRTF